MAFTVLAYNVMRPTAGPAVANDTTLTITCPAVPTRQLWLVEAIVVECSSATVTELLVYDREPTNSVPCGGSRYGNFTADDQCSPLLVQSGDALKLVWTGCSKGSLARARIQYKVLTGSPASPTPVAV